MHSRERFLLQDLRALGAVEAPPRLLAAILDEVDLVDRFASLETALGPVFVAWNRLGVSAVMKTATPEEFEARFRERFGRVPRRAAELPETLGVQFDLRSVTEFERAVLLKAREIPRGQVRTYGWIAAEIGRPAAVRAVGTALRKNPVPLLIPCHRVVRSDGHIGEYALGGSDAKRAILASEGIDGNQISQVARLWRPAREGNVTASG
jgi:methylated-DNA-[protein]-cysteine S-methyltransferase